MKLTESIKKFEENTKSAIVKMAIMTGLISALTVAVNKTSQAQTLVNKKQHNEILEKTRNAQESIGEDLAKFIFGGGVERWLQLEIKKQNSKHGEDSKDEDFSLFKNDKIKNADEK